MPEQILPYPVPTRIYHITHLDNLEGILQTGGLLPYSQRPPTQQNVAYGHIQDRRAEVVVPVGPEGNLHDYVPFYFCPRSPMLGAIHTQSTKYQGGQGRILHLVSSAQKVAKARLPFVFTDRHAAVQGVRFFHKLAHLKDLDWKAIQARYWAEVREKKQAEFLVKGLFPWGLIEEIGVINASVKAEVEAILARFPNLPHPPVRVRRNWYY
ncbi:type II toxin-antitoxin system toxin DNA ADP-ribosyl transferase DarT [Thermus sp.]|uniref:type II toxin-antitoxin system toxin DNA ADP-ribosyl transferase DarT n=1 Tax=Thermus sp. TaxID=275 RepID=UPI003D142308